MRHSCHADDRDLDAAIIATQCPCLTRRNGLLMLVVLCLQHDATASPGGGGGGVSAASPRVGRSPRTAGASPRGSSAAGGSQYGASPFMPIAAAGGPPVLLTSLAAPVFQYRTRAHQKHCLCHKHHCPTAVPWGSCTASWSSSASHTTPRPAPQLCLCPSTARQLVRLCCVSCPPLQRRRRRRPAPAPRTCALPASRRTRS